MSGRDSTELYIRKEYEWLNNHNPIREYLFVRYDEDLDDDIPL